MKLKLEIAIMLRRLTDEEFNEVVERIDFAMVIRNRLRDGRLSKQQLMKILGIDDERFLKDYLNCYKRLTDGQLTKIMTS